MKTTSISQSLRRLKKINDEISYASVAEARSYSSGVILFRPRRAGDAKQIVHTDKDVLCHVIRGGGRLWVDGRKIPLKAGMLCRIPKGTPHDFAAGKKSPLVLFYSLIQTADKA
jgi:mannose-6-phosphate isomerase-like protein (cupin superfamily)